MRLRHVVLKVKVKEKVNRTCEDGIVIHVKMES